MNHEIRRAYRFLHGYKNSRAVYAGIQEKCPMAKDEPVRASASDVVDVAGQGKYFCYGCLAAAKQPAKVQPLLGSSTTRMFERVKVDLGRCDVCETGKAVCRSLEAQTRIYEDRYARLVQE